MHIIYIHQYFITPDQQGGTRSYEMARRLINAGHKVSMICSTSDLTGIQGQRGSVIQSHIDGIDVYRIIEPYSNYMSFARRWIAFMRFARKALKVAKTLCEVDLVFATSTPLTVGPLGRKAAKFHRCPFVFEVRDLWPERPITLGILKSRILICYLRRMEYQSYHSAQHVITLAPRMTEGVVETNYPRERVTMIPNSCDLDLFIPQENHAEIDHDPRFGRPGDFRLVHAGANGLVNGVGAALDAVAVLKCRGIAGIHFSFIGDGAQTPMLKKRCEDEGLNDCVSWVKPIPKNEIARILPQMDVGMML
ncbi:MAG: glycosyltransferase family 4 protein, partial [Planctomycetaceae bacterium]|nr:glycosyltransferase family 4 protein [Planctomycetaceae bacterium]